MYVCIYIITYIPYVCIYIHIYHIYIRMNFRLSMLFRVVLSWFFNVYYSRNELHIIPHNAHACNKELKKSKKACREHVPQSMGKSWAIDANVHVLVYLYYKHLIYEHEQTLI